MTPKQRRAIERHVVRLAPELGLDGWVFNLHPDEAEGGKAAAVSCVYGRRIAHVYFCTDWWDLPPLERQHVLVHELIHVVLDSTTTYLSETLPDLLGQPTWRAVDSAHRQHMEHAVDQLATTLAPHLPVCEEVA